MNDKFEKLKKDALDKLKKENDIKKEQINQKN